MKRIAIFVVAVLLIQPTEPSAQEKSSLSIHREKTKDKDYFDIMAGKELITRYHITQSAPKPIFWPVNAPGGVPLTRDWPMIPDAPDNTKDHPHQQSAWFCHGDIIPEGIVVKDKIKGIEGVDFWSIAKGHGNMVCTYAAEPKVDKNRIRLATKNEWRTADGVKIMDEARDIYVYDFGKARLIVLNIDLHASVCPIVFGDTKEGAMGIRISDKITEVKGGKGKIQNAEGKVGEKNCWGQIANWCDYSGPIDGKTVGLAVLADPKNAYPSCWHARGYGLMAANPFGREKARFPGVAGKKELVRLAKGEHLKLRYAMLLHQGDAETGNVAEYYQRFVALREKE